MFLRRLTGWCLAALLVAGCGSSDAPDTDGNGIPDATVPGYVQVIKDLGIWDAVEKVSVTMPPYLQDVQSVDGKAPYDVEVLRDVPFKQTPLRTLTVNIHRPVAQDGNLRRAVVLYMGGGFLVDIDFEVIEAWADYMASRGLVVFNARQRLITEPGVTLVEAFSDA